MTFLLKKKVIAVVVVLLLTVTAMFFVLAGNRGEFVHEERVVETAPHNRLIASAASVQPENTDSDKDNLKDWEEALWGTDPYNPDTDGDGTRDGIEVEVERNPLVAGPDDALRGSPATLHNDGTEIELSESDQFARTIFSEYVSLRKRGLLQNESGQNFLVNSLIAKVPSFKESGYLLSDLVVSNDTNSETLRRYGNQMGSIIERFSINNRNEAVILLDALQSESPEILEELKPIKAAYHSMRREALLVVVPQSAVHIHLGLINSFAGMEATITAMEHIFDNPISTVSALGTYQETAGELLQALLGANKFFLKEQIVFAESEPGYTFANFVREQ